MNKKQLVETIGELGAILASSETTKEQKADAKAKLNSIKSKVQQTGTAKDSRMAKRYREVAAVYAKEDPARAQAYLDKADQLEQSVIDNKLDQDKIDMAQAKMLLSSGTKADIGELQQLWKDNKRFMTMEKQKYGEKSESYLQALALQGRLEAKLASLSPDIWAGGAAENKNSDLTPEQIAAADALKAEVVTFTDEINAKLVDGDNDGIIDAGTDKTTAAKLKASVRKFVKDKKLGNEDKDALLTLIEDAVEEFKSNKNQSDNNKGSSLERTAKAEANKANRLKNFKTKQLGAGADAVANTLRATVRGMTTAVGSESTYIAMKKALGDAISGGDFAGIADFQGAEGMKSKVNAFLGNNALTETKAKRVLEQLIKGFNAGIASYNADIKGRLGSGGDAGTIYKQLSVSKVPMPKLKSGKKDYRRKKTKKKETIVTDADAFFGRKR